MLARRERGVDEPVLDARVLVAGEPDGVGAVDRPAGAADLLVQRDRGARHLEVHDEREVGLVVAHAERGGRDDALELVRQQLRLDVELGVGALGAEVRARFDALGLQPVGDAARVLDGERVDDAGAGQLRQPLREPGQAIRLRGQVQHVEGEALPIERTAQHEEIAAELLDDVVDDPVVRGRGRAEHGDAGGEEVDARVRGAGSRGGSRDPSR